jgi:hypothetical protein
MDSFEQGTELKEQTSRDAATETTGGGVEANPDQELMGESMPSRLAPESPPLEVSCPITGDDQNSAFQATEFRNLAASPTPPAPPPGHPPPPFSPVTLSLQSTWWGFSGCS